MKTSFVAVLLASAVSAQYGLVGNIVNGVANGLAGGLGGPRYGPPPPFFEGPRGPGPRGPGPVGFGIDAATSPENPALASFCIAQNTNTRNLTP